ncbi:RNA polymerase sigma factor [Erythrobacter sp.]|uniref:RNA polymerase sigma factor n=1 Tax=Sphingomonadales TaxID=204457 RepID=UPI003267CA18
MRDLTDAKLVVLAATLQDKGAYTELFRRHCPALKAFLLRLAGHQADAEDLAQATFLRAFDKLPQFRAEASFKTWLFRIGYTEFLQLQRSQRYQERLKNDLLTEYPNSNSLSQDTAIDLEKGLAQLSAEERSAILLCDAVGFSNKDTAETMSVPLGSMKTYLRRARRKLRIHMEGKRGHDGSA